MNRAALSAAARQTAAKVTVAFVVVVVTFPLANAVSVEYGPVAAAVALGVGLLVALFATENLARLLTGDVDVE